MTVYLDQIFRVQLSQKRRRVADGGQSAGLFIRSRDEPHVRPQSGLAEHIAYLPAQQSFAAYQRDRFSQPVSPDSVSAVAGSSV